MEENINNQNLLGNQTITETQIPPKGPNLFLLGAGVIVLLGLGLLGGYFLWGSNVLNKSQNITPTPISSVSNNSQAGEETSNWLTYINTKHNYSIRYPNGYNIVKGPLTNEPESSFQTMDNISFDKTNNSGFSVVFNINVNPTDANGSPLNCTSDNNCLQSWLKVLNKSENEITNLNGIVFGRKVEGFEYKNPQLEQTNRYYVFIDNNKIWVINLTLNKHSTAEEAVAIEEFDQILSTFKFTDQNQTNNMTNWKTYNSSRCSFSIKTPPDWIVRDSDLVPGANDPNYNYGCIEILAPDYKFSGGSATGLSIYISRTVPGTKFKTITINSMDNYIRATENILEPAGSAQNLQAKTLGGLSGKYYEFGALDYRSNFVFMTNNFIFNANWLRDYSGTYKPYIDQILSTFKFTGQN